MRFLVCGVACYTWGLYSSAQCLESETTCIHAYMAACMHTYIHDHVLYAYICVSHVYMHVDKCPALLSS